MSELWGSIDYHLLMNSDEIVPEPGTYCKWCPYECSANPRFLKLQQMLDKFEINAVLDDPYVDDSWSFRV